MYIKTLMFIALFFILGSWITQAQAQVSADNFGEETIKQIKKGKYTLSCNDAKYFVVLAQGVLKDIGTLDKPSQRDKNFEKVLRKFEKNVKELAASKDKETGYKIKDAIDEGLGKLFNLVMEKHYGQVEASELNEYMNANFCGKKR